MKLVFENYDKGAKIVSLAKDEVTMNDLKFSNLDFLYFNKKEILLFPDDIRLNVNQSIINQFLIYNNYDVLQICEDGEIIKCYDDASVDNYFFISGKCNSNCIMCPTPDMLRKKGQNTDISTLIKIAKHIPSDTVHLTLTGGEPFMIGEQIFELIEFLKSKFENTEFLILTNGRIFAIEKYVRKLKETIPNRCVVGIPIHGSCSHKHDKITQTPGSFFQTITGIKRLLSNGIQIELRLVACNLNSDDFSNIARLIIDEMPDINHISIMATEMTGSAIINKDIVWLPYREIFSLLEEAISILIEGAIDVNLYNFPLCTVKRRFWTLCKKSISPHKVRYAFSCNECNMKAACGGLFASTFLLEKNELEAIL